MRHGIPQDLMALDEEKFIAMMQKHLGIGIGGGGGGGADSDRLRSSHLRTLPHRWRVRLCAARTACTACSQHAICGADRQALTHVPSAALRATAPHARATQSMGLGFDLPRTAAPTQTRMTPSTLISTATVPFIAIAHTVTAIIHAVIAVIHAVIAVMHAVVAVIHAIIAVIHTVYCDYSYCYRRSSYRYRRYSYAYRRYS
jgi:hypothetical protein